MLINLRNALMTGRRLPYDAEVEYLESTGTQYIDLGFSLTPSSDLYATVMLRGVVVNAGIFGQSNQLFWNANNPAYTISNTLVGKIFFAYGPTDNLYISGVGVNTLTDISYVGTTYTINGTTTTIPRVSSWSTVQGNAHVFCRGYADGSISPISNASVYSIKIVDNGATTHHFIPVRKGTVGYLYDRVSGKLFGNAGTGDFVLGPDVVPVEWLCSSANNIASSTAVPPVWIDTGIALSTDIKMSLVASFASLQYNRLIGVYGGPSGRFDIGVSGNGTFLTSIGATTPNTTSDTYVHKFVLDAPNHMGYVDENGVSTGSDFSVTIQGNIMLFSRGRGDRQPPVDYYSQASKTVVTIYSAEIWKANALVRSFFPVRVGTDATSWEGAMMDVLTRRIYRNAGTGAFTYGNDLKYPIPAS